LKAFFEAQLESARTAEQNAQRRFARYAIARVAAFVAMGFSLWQWYAGEWILAPYVVPVSAMLFLWLMWRQQAIRRERNFQRSIQTVNRDEIGRLSYVFEREDTGESFLSKEHPYAADLDIFGKHSVFRLFNRTRTSGGRERLAEWLMHHAPLEVILMRQEALAACRQDHSWRARWQATALLHELAAQQAGALSHWIGQSMDADLRKGLRWKWWSLITIPALLLWVSGIIPGWPVAFSLVFHILLIRRYAGEVRNLTTRTYTLGKTLIAYADLLELAEQAPFQGRWWSGLIRRGDGPSNALRSLGNWLNRLDFRHNAFFGVLAGIPLLWDLICLDALEKWKKRYKDLFPGWMDALANIEAMNSFSGYAFAHPDLLLPRVSWSDHPEITAKGLGHPLIPDEKRVSNDFDLQGLGKTVLITGSNMSGKSTFLRTVGLNLVLAQAGSVVAAEAFGCSLMRVFSSMRTQDSLEENTSSFYAELKRLRQLLDYAAVQGGTPVFYILDEILKGTNSTDRQKGAEALIRQLHPMRATGLVSTHDLGLGAWGASQDYVRNYHFRSDISEGQLSFDYRLHPGICQSFNAAELMRMMGIKIQPDDEKSPGSDLSP